MENIKFIGAQNEIQKIYSDLGLIVPVGDLDNGKAPAIQPLPATSTTTAITAKFNVMSGAEISSLSYKVNDGEATSITPAKGVVTITLSDLEYNSGPYEIELTATNETGSTEATATVDLQPYTDWAIADEVLEGNKFIGEDGQESVGTYVPEEPATGPLIVTTNGEYTAEGTEWVGFDDVFVDVPTGPTDGGAVISSVELVDDGGFECVVTFDTMPELDTTNHKYAADLIAYCVEQSGVFADQTYHYNNMTSIPQSSCVIDSTLNTITFFDVNSPCDGAGNILSSTQGYILIYEDGYDNLKYKMSCTVTVPDANL